jgi:hypothetical protein
VAAASDTTMLNRIMNAGETSSAFFFSFTLEEEKDASNLYKLFSFYFIICSLFIG